MRVILDIKDNMALPLMQVLNSLPYVKTKPIEDEEPLIITELEESILNLDLAKKEN